MVRTLAAAVAVALLAVALLAVAVPLHAQLSSAPIERTVLQRVDVPGAANMVLRDIASGVIVDEQRGTS